MKIVATIAERAAAAGLPFLVIGGNAVIAYGYPRQTADLDLLVREPDRRAWDELIRPLGFHPHQLQRAFHMYNPTERGLPAVDLMVVDAATFEKLSTGSTEAIVHQASVRIPALSHLIALKLHALRSNQPHRRELDMGDVLTLVQLNKVDLAAPEYAEILERYASPALRDEIRLRLAGPQSPAA